MVHGEESRPIHGPLRTAEVVSRSVAPRSVNEDHMNDPMAEWIADAPSRLRAALLSKTAAVVGLLLIAGGTAFAVNQYTGDQPPLRPRRG
jgi:hypothetical protein